MTKKNTVVCTIEATVSDR